MLRNRDIILIASAPWKTHGMLNCHYIAKRLARDNRVLYVESPGLRTPSPFHRDDLLKVFDRLRGWFRCRVDGPVRVMRGLHVLSPLCFPFQGFSTVSRLNSVWLGHVCATAQELDLAE